MLWRQALLPGRISTAAEPLLRRSQANAFMTTNADQGSERDVMQLVQTMKRCSAERAMSNDE